MCKKTYETAKRVELSGDRPFSCHVNVFSVFSVQNGLVCLVVYENFWLPEHLRGWWSAFGIALCTIWVECPVLQKCPV